MKNDDGDGTRHHGGERRREIWRWVRGVSRVSPGCNYQTKVLAKGDK